ncbi:MAG: energy-coupling factor transporter ATPase [Candidatus Izemoplasmatales bacterium]|jgi:energy-coupling factor transport system ATP-binding protein|nr:energy-coupling factor transporter ATPase [Candidatus Izemoplasmatales bacterium]
MSKVKVEDLTFSYNQRKMILKNINLEVQKGEWVAILGHNGSGKSTLAKTMVGLLEPAAGHIYIDDILLSEETSYELRKKIGIVFQNPDNQFVGVTVKDDIAFGMENLCFSKEEMLENIDFFAKKVGVFDYLDKEPSLLSGGQKQRVAIAGILAMKTDIIIFDEATSMLDPYAREDLMKYIKKLHEDGLTIIMITHDIEEALFADKLVILKEGKILLEGDKSAVFHQPRLFEDANLELPVALRISNELDGAEFSAWKEYLWAYSLEK